jgi:hypothetical protein
MPRKQPAKRSQFDALLAEERWTSIGALEWTRLRGMFGETSLREWLRESDVPVEQPYRGVETKTLESLEDSLRAMSALYSRDPAQRKLCRATVIAAKDRMRFASRNEKVDPTKRAMKAEMVEWLLVWLGDPELFEPWVALRKRQM